MKSIPHADIPLEEEQLQETGLLRMIWQSTGWHQVIACTLGVVVALLSLVPVELQRRAIDDAIADKNVQLLAILCAAYVLFIVLHQLAKFILNSYQVWIGESVTQFLRGEVIEVEREDDSETETEVVSIMVSETEKLGEFVGEGVSQVFIDIGMLVGMSAYMLYIEPMIALFAFALLLPQVIVTPLLQSKLNVLIEKQVNLKRRLSNEVVGADAQLTEAEITTDRLFNNKTHFALMKFAMKATLNLLSALAPIVILAVGGYMVIQGETTVGVIVAFLSGFVKIAAPAKGMITFYRNWAQSNVQHGLIVDWFRDNADLSK